MVKLTMFRRRPKPKLFLKMLLSYFLILLIPVIVGTYAYYQTVDVVREDAAYLNLAVLEQSEDILNQLLLEIRDVVALLSLDTKILSVLLNADKNWSPDILYEFSLQRNDLNKLSTNKFFSDLFVYFRNSEAIISSDQIDRLHNHPMQMGQQSFGQWLEQMIAEQRLNKYHYVENVSQGSVNGNYLVYLSPLPLGFSGRVDGAVVIFINEQSIGSLFNRLLTEQGSFAYIMDRDRQVITSASASGDAVQPLNPLQLEADEGKNYRFMKVDGQNMLVTFKQSGRSGWTYVAGLPAEAVLSKADYIKRINYTIVFIALVLGCLIALLLAYRNSKPLSELLDSIKEFAGGGEGTTTRRSNEMDLLKNTVNHIISSNKKLNVRMNEQLPLLQAACLERLLKSGFNSEEQMQTHFRQAEIEYQRQHVLVAVIRIDYTGTEKSKMMDDKDKLMLILDHEFKEQCWLHDLKLGKLALIYLFQEESEQQIAIVEEQLRELQQLLQQQFNMPTAIGLGQVYGDVMDAWRSYNEANQALDCLSPYTSQLIIRFDLLTPDSNHYYYPLDLELKLINMVRLGDLQGLQRLLQHIETQNFEQRQLSLLRKKQLFAELIGTLLKLTEQLKPTPESPDANFERISKLETQEVSSFEQVQSAFIALAHHMISLKDNKLHHQIESMKHYINAQYKDSNLSLSMLASEFQQSESYVSTFFKEQTGFTFSEYLERLRLEEACRQLRSSDEPIQEIALRTGYNSDKSFRRAFKRAFGIQPTTYRKESAASE